MSTSPPNPNHGRLQEKQKWRGHSKPSNASSNSEVILILGEPTPGELSTMLRWRVHPSSGTRQRLLLIFASDLRGLPKSSFQTPHVDIHILSKRLRESSGLNSQCPNQAPGEAIHLVGVLERASQFAVAWRADAERSISDDQLIMGDPYFSSRRGSAHSSHLSDTTHAIDSLKGSTTPATLHNVNGDNHWKLRRPLGHQYVQSNSNSKFTASRSTVSASKGLLPSFLNFSSPSVPRPSSPSIYQPQNTTHPGFRCQSLSRYSLQETNPRTFDTIFNFLPPDLTERSLLKQVILISTLCGQYFARSEPEIPPLSPRRAFGSPTSRASSLRRTSSRGAPYSQNPKEKANALSPRTRATESKAGVEPQRISTTSSGSSSGSGSASSARCSTPSETSAATTVSGTQQRRWSLLSWLSSTSTSQASEPEPVATSVDSNADVLQRKSIELRRRLSHLFGRTPKRSESSLNRSAQGELSTAPEGEETDHKRRSMKIPRPSSHKHGYLIHVLPTSLATSHSSHALQSQGTRAPIPEKRPPPLSLSGGLNGSTETTTRSFTHARMQTSFMRRPNLQQMRLRNLERRYSLPAACTEREASRMTLNPMSRGGSLTKGPVQSQKREKPPFADHVLKFLDDYFGQGNRGDVLPFVFDAGVFEREVNVNMKSGSKKRILVGEAVLSGLFDEFAMNGQCWVGDEDLRCLVNHLQVDDEEEMEEPVEEETVTPQRLSMAPKHPQPAAISPSSSEGSEGAGPAATPSSQRGRSRAISDLERNVATTSPGAAMQVNTLKAPEPAHIYPHSRPPTSLAHYLTKPTASIPAVDSNGSPASKFSASKRPEL